MPGDNKIAVSIIAAIALILIIAIALTFLYFWEKNHSDFSSDEDWEVADYIVYEGKKYTLRDDVGTFLLIGLDKFGEAVDVQGDSYNNDSRADFLTLFVIDHRSGSIATVAINRDTMAEMNVLGIGGKKVGTVVGQLALSHTYGSGGEDSGRNTARAVSGLLGGLKIDRFVSVTMDAVSTLNDMVGGVTVTVPEDLTAIDESLTEGAVVTLHGELALNYVRYRQGLDDSTNAARMERQRQYMDALYLKLKDYVATNDGFSADAVSSLSKYMISSSSLSELEELADHIEAYESAGNRKIEGEFRVGEFMEFHADDTSIKKILVELFYEPEE
ncbi:MAG: LCP family protein [Clostridia bacterium]|nr:LCP family protein [Clostridia bacterium]